MTTPEFTAAAELDTIHPDSFLPRDCVSGECVDGAQIFPDDGYAHHFDTRDDVISAVAATDWQLGADGLRCADCAPTDNDRTAVVGAGVPATHDWLAEVRCVVVQCTRCQRILESDCGDAHFHSVQAAAEAALAARWLVSTHKVWCRTCTALVHGVPSHTLAAASPSDHCGGARP